MPEIRSALIVANWKYEDEDLRQLVAPANDAEALAGVLRDPKICGFEVTTLLNRPSREACEQIERFFLDRKRDDLLLLYFSCHGIKDDDGLLYFAAPDTRLIEHGRPLRSTALSADFVRSVMRASSSRRQVLMLDCCYSGAFAGAMLSKGDKSAGVKDQFEQGRGMVVMTASDALQYSFEGDSVAGEAVNSIFTRVLVKGLETGEADHDRDGTISLDELYDYVYERVVKENANQRPKKWDLGVEGKIVVAQTPVVRAAELAPELLEAIHSPFSRVRLGVVGELGDLLNGGHKGLALAARAALERLAEDDSRQVSAAAGALLGRGMAEPTPAQHESPRVSATAPTHGAQEEDVEVVEGLPVVVQPKTPTPSPVAKIDLSPAAEHAAGMHEPQTPAATHPEQPWPRNEAQPKPPIGDEEDVRNKLALWRSPYTYVGLLLILLLVGVLVYRSNRSGGQPNQSSGQQEQTGGGKTETPANANPLTLPAPPFDYTLNVPQAEDTKVRLTQVSSKPNQITDDEEWFKSNDLALPVFTVPNSFKQETGDLPSQIPPTQGNDRIIKAIKQDDRVLAVYGTNFADGRYLTSFNLASGKPEFAFDFHEYMHPPKYLNADREYVDETVNWAQVKGNILYVSNGHSTYARSSFNQNAYLNAIDIGSGRLLWRSQPLVSNSANFLLYHDAIITGYGFTQESHFLYVVNQKDGRIVQTIPVRKSPDYILNKGDDIYVRTYDTDLVFKAGEP